MKQIVSWDYCTHNWRANLKVEQISDGICVYRQLSETLRPHQYTQPQARSLVGCLRACGPLLVYENSMKLGRDSSFISMYKTYRKMVRRAFLSLDISGENGQIYKQPSGSDASCDSLLQLVGSTCRYPVVQAFTCVYADKWAGVSAMMCTRIPSNMFYLCTTPFPSTALFVRVHRVRCRSLAWCRNAVANTSPITYVESWRAEKNLLRKGQRGKEAYVLFVTSIVQSHFNSQTRRECIVSLQVRRFSSSFSASFCSTS